MLDETWWYLLIFVGGFGLACLTIPVMMAATGIWKNWYEDVKWFILGSD